MRLRKDAKVERLKRVPLFAHCSKRELGLIASLADEVDLEEGKTLVREGAFGHEFFVLVDGAVEVRKGKRKVATLGPGDFFGEIALISKILRTATVITTQPVRALVITTRDFWTLLEASPELKTKVLKALADRLATDAL
jgi:CRP/FNR family transcriptional regulator, cyclic AMP receptor protein